MANRRQRQNRYDEANVERAREVNRDLDNRNEGPWPNRNEPSPCEPGSIEQQLDMCETGDLRGDLVLGHRDEIIDDPDEAIEDPREMEHNYRVDMAETNREGDEASGDEHSRGLQGGEPDIEHQEHIATGMPGDMTEKEEEEIDRIARRTGDRRAS